jgi:hypothetical protein
LAVLRLTTISYLVRGFSPSPDISLFDGPPARRCFPT